MKKLWNDIWYSENNSKEFSKSKKKYDTIKEELYKFIDKSKKQYKYNEWEIPKGRRNQDETNKDCAIREFRD